jgi:hypothetical protein
MHPTHVALYARVSSEQQAAAQTIASQVAALRERAATVLQDAGEVQGALGADEVVDGNRPRRLCVGRGDADEDETAKRYNDLH